jgi:hypothetical protein
MGSSGASPRRLNVRLGCYVLAEAITLATFAVIQCILSPWWVMRCFCGGVFWIVFCAMFLTTMSGVAIGLVISALVHESKTAVLVIPVVLIPQIILAGALIKYEDMNRDLDFVYSITQWAARHPGSAMEPRSDLKVPLICQFMQMRWSYEALVFAQAKHNPLTGVRRVFRRRSTEHRGSRAVAGGAEPPRGSQDLLAVLSGLRRNPRRSRQEIRGN